MRDIRSAKPLFRTCVCTLRTLSVATRRTYFPSTTVSYCRRRISGNKVCTISIRTTICSTPFSIIT